MGKKKKKKKLIIYINKHISSSPSSNIKEKLNFEIKFYLGFITGRDYKKTNKNSSKYKARWITETGLTSDCSRSEWLLCEWGNGDTPFKVGHQSREKGGRLTKEMYLFLIIKKKKHEKIFF